MSLVGRKPLPMVLESANIRYNQTTDYIEVLNPNTNVWESWQQSGVIFEGTNIIVTTKNLNGSVVTCTINGESYTATIVGGSATFTVYSGGTATVTCEGISKTVTVEEGKAVTTDITRTPATLKLTTENLNGKTVTVQINGMTYTGIFTNKTYTFTIYEVGTATITCDTVTLSQTIASAGSYTVDVTKPFAVIDLTTPNLNGHGVTLTVDGVTYNGTFVDGFCRFTVYYFGTATIKSTGISTTLEVASGQTYTKEIVRPYATLNFTTNDMEGQTVSVVINGNSYTATFSGKKCTLTLYEFGTASVSCGYATTTQLVESGGTYTINLDRPYAVINLTTTNLNGHNVTVTVNGVNYPATFASGKATITVYEFGTATIASTGISTTLSVAKGGSYNVELIRPYAVINLTTTNLNGHNVTVKIGSGTYTGTFANNACSFTVYEFGTATVTSTDSSISFTVASGQTYDKAINRPQAVLNFTTGDLNGKTINVKINNNNYTATFANYRASLTLYEFGTATITCGYDSVTQEVAAGQSYTVNLNRPYCTINLTSSNLDGQPVTVTVGGNTYTGTFTNGACSIKVYDVFGTATITSTNCSTTLTVADGGTYTKALNRPQAKINLTTSNLQSQTIYFSVDGGAQQTAAFGSDGTLTLTVYVFGTYTFTCSETTVTQVVEAAGTYTVDITEITRVYFLENGVLQNGAKMETGSQYFTPSQQSGYCSYANSGSSTTYDMIEIPKDATLAGKTLYVEYRTNPYIPDYSRFRWGLTSKKFYVDFGKSTESIHSTAITASMFSEGYEENLYVSAFIQQYQRIEVVNIYVE